MNRQLELITELNMNFSDLGEDLVLLEAVLQTDKEETEFPEEYIASSLRRMADCVEEHTKTIHQLTRYLVD